MNKKRIEIEVTEYSDLSELGTENQQLIRHAMASVSRSYAPYSHFRVGAAVQLKDGTIVCGTNQENAAYPSGICAERIALFYANSTHPDQPVTAMAIAAAHEKGFTENPISPCGACRQVLLESEYRFRHPIRVLLYGTQRIYGLNRVTDLLPFSFSEDQLK